MIYLLEQTLIDFILVAVENVETTFSSTEGVYTVMSNISSATSPCPGILLAHLFLVHLLEKQM